MDGSEVLALLDRAPYLLHEGGVERACGAHADGAPCRACYQMERKVHSVAAAEARLLRECAVLRQSLSEAEAQKDVLQEDVARLEVRVAAVLADHTTTVRELTSQKEKTSKQAAQLQLLMRQVDTAFKASAVAGARNAAQHELLLKNHAALLKGYTEAEADAGALRTATAAKEGPAASARHQFPHSDIRRLERQVGKEQEASQEAAAAAMAAEEAESSLQKELAEVKVLLANYERREQAGVLSKDATITNLMKEELELCKEQLTCGKMHDKDVAYVHCNINSTALAVKAWQTQNGVMPERVDFIASGGFGHVYRAEMADSEQLVAVKITPLYPEEDRNMFHIMAAATAMDVAVGGCLAECGAHVPNRVMHRVSRTTYCDMTNGFCETVDACGSCTCKACNAMREGKTIWVHDVMQLAATSMAALVHDGPSNKPTWAQQLKACPEMRRALAKGAASVARTISQAHSAMGAVHADINSNQILLKDANDLSSWMLTDFGLCSLVPGGTSAVHELHTRQGGGTPEYMAPEQWGRTTHPEQGGQALHLGGASDVFSFGILLLEVFTGKSYWEVARLKDAGKQARQWPDDLDSRVDRMRVPAWFPKRLLTLITHCVCAAPEKRYTMCMVADALEYFAGITPEAGDAALGWW